MEFGCEPALRSHLSGSTGIVSAQLAAGASSYRWISCLAKYQAKKQQPQDLRPSSGVIYTNPLSYAFSEWSWTSNKQTYVLPRTMRQAHEYNEKKEYQAEACGLVPKIEKSSSSEQVREDKCQAEA